MTTRPRLRTIARPLAAVALAATVLGATSVPAQAAPQLTATKTHVEPAPPAWNHAFSVGGSSYSFIGSGGSYSRGSYVAAAALAKAEFPHTTGVIMTDGENLADAVSAGPLAGTSPSSSWTPMTWTSRASRALTTSSGSPRTTGER